MQFPHLLCSNKCCVPVAYFILSNSIGSSVTLVFTVYNWFTILYRAIKPMNVVLHYTVTGARIGSRYIGMYIVLLRK